MPQERDTNQIAEDKVRSVDNLRELLFDASPVFCAGIGADGKLRMMNATMLHALGYTADEVIGKDYISMFVPERDRDLLLRVFKMLNTESLTVNENWVIAKDGTEFLVEWRGSIVRNPTGQFDCYIGIGVDITERRSVEQALRQSEQKLALHVQQTPLGVIEFDLGFRITEWNPAAEKIFGYSREEALGRNAAELITPENLRTQVDTLWNDLLIKKSGIRTTTENITKSGKTITCDWYNTPLVDTAGRMMGAASHVDDVTEQKRLEAELRRREQAQAETIEQLSAPILDLWEGVVAMPVIGEVDERRATKMTETLLATIMRAQASFTVIDLTGIHRMDARVADCVLQMVRAAGLLGCRCLVSGISPESAQTMVQLDRDLGGLHTFGTLRDALGHVLRLRGTGRERQAPVRP